jgi:hypothetical protein
VACDLYVDVKSNAKKQVLNRDWTMCSNMLTVSDHSMSMRIVTFTWTPNSRESIHNRDLKPAPISQFLLDFHISSKKWVCCGKTSNSLKTCLITLQQDSQSTCKTGHRQFYHRIHRYKRTHTNPMTHHPSCPESRTPEFTQKSQFSRIIFSLVI